MKYHFGLLLNWNPSLLLIDITRFKYNFLIFSCYRIKISLSVYLSFLKIYAIVIKYLRLLQKPYSLASIQFPCVTLSKRSLGIVLARKKQRKRPWNGIGKRVANISRTRFANWFPVMTKAYSILAEYKRYVKRRKIFVSLVFLQAFIGTGRIVIA